MERTRQSYDQSLRQLHRQLLKMSSRVERMIDGAVTSLAQTDTSLAGRVIADDDEIDELEYSIEDACTRLIALQQPVARDLRVITSALKVIHDLERMGDHSVDIAQVTLQIAPQGLIKPLVDIPRMARTVQGMVREALDAFVRVDVDLAERVCARDDSIDTLYNELCEELCGISEEEPQKTRQAIYLIMVSRHLERIADHATNVAERAIYLKTGRHQRNLTKRDSGKWGA